MKRPPSRSGERHLHVVPSSTPPSTGEYRVVAIRRIKISDRLRAVDERGLEELVGSIKLNGVLEPPIVDEHLALIAGARRVGAAKLAGLSEIGVIVRALDPIRRELAEIDENLCRLELTPLERGEHTARRKRLYEELHPETRVGGAPGKRGGGKKPSGKVSFVVDVAERTGRGASTIAEDCRIGSMAPEVRKALKGTGAAKRKSELLLLAKQAPSDQVAVAGQLRDGTASSVVEAVRRLDQERGRGVDGEESSSVSVTPDDDDVEAVDDGDGEGAEEDDETNSIPAIFSHLEQLEDLRDQVAAMLKLTCELERAWTDEPGPDVAPLMTDMLRVRAALSTAYKLVADRIVPERACSECDSSDSECQHCAGKGWLSRVEAARFDDEGVDSRRV